jgi:aminopeptidase N
MGFDTMKSGLQKYFNKFSWKNTTLDDFVECMDEAHKESGNVSMGADF